MTYWNVSVNVPNIPNCRVGYDAASQEIVVWGPCGNGVEFPLDQIPAVIAACYKQCPHLTAITITPGRGE